MGAESDCGGEEEDDDDEATAAAAGTATADSTAAAFPLMNGASGQRSLSPHWSLVTSLNLSPSVRPSIWGPNPEDSDSMRLIHDDLI